MSHNSPKTRSLPRASQKNPRSNKAIAAARGVLVAVTFLFLVTVPTATGHLNANRRVAPCFLPSGGSTSASSNSRGGIGTWSASAANANAKNGGGNFVPQAAQRGGTRMGLTKRNAGAGGGEGKDTKVALAAATGVSGGGGESAPPSKAKPKKVRITAFDSMRFFLIQYIICGHFIAFANPTPFAARFFSQVNVVVGAFFALSGYVAAYTSTENAERAASPKLLSTPPSTWILSRVFGYYPLHLLVLFLFSPVFLYPDVFYSGWPTALWHGFLSVTMTQAWFPLHAEVWNAPTWFLSALTTATVALPFSLPYLSKMKKRELRVSLGFLFLLGLLPRIGYCYDHGAWSFLEGMMPPKTMPNLASFNNQRFNPFYATVEVLMGAAACRLVMLDGVADEEGGAVPKTNLLSTGLPLLGLVGVIYSRAAEALKLSDMLTRSFFFLPLFLRFLMSTHRASVSSAGGGKKNADPLLGILSSKPLVALGALSFPMFIVHGPIGQVCYKKIVATKLFGGTLNKVVGPEFYFAYLAIVVVAAFVLQKTFLSSKAVAGWSKDMVSKISSLM